MTTVRFTGIIRGSIMSVYVAGPESEPQLTRFEDLIHENGFTSGPEEVVNNIPADTPVIIRIVNINYDTHSDRCIFTGDDSEYVVWQQRRRQFNPTPAEQGGSTTVVPSQQDIARREREQHVAYIVNSMPIPLSVNAEETGLVPRMEVEVDFGLPPEEDSEDNTMRFLVVHDPGCMITVQNAMTAKRIYDGFRTAVIGNHTWMTIPTNVPLSIECAWPDGMVDAINGFGYDDAHNAVSFVKNRVVDFKPTEVPSEFTGIRAIRL